MHWNDTLWCLEERNFYSEIILLTLWVSLNEHLLFPFPLTAAAADLSQTTI